MQLSWAHICHWFRFWGMLQIHCTCLSVRLSVHNILFLPDNTSLNKNKTHATNFKSFNGKCIVRHGGLYCIYYNYHEVIGMDKQTHAPSALQCLASVWWWLLQSQTTLWCALNHYTCKKPTRPRASYGQLGSYTHPTVSGCMNHQPVVTHWRVLGTLSCLFIVLDSCCCWPTRHISV